MKYPACPRCGINVTGLMLERPTKRTTIRETDPKTKKTTTRFEHAMGDEALFFTFPCRHALTSTQFTKLVTKLRARVKK